MKLVQKIKVKGTIYKIYISQVPNGVEGLCYKVEKEIILGNHLSVDRMLSTLAHELAHAFCHETFMDQTLDRTQEEIFCEIVACMMTEYSDFFRELKKKLK
jgi:Zn-dependent peptidase ImmA (M78 family)